MRYFIALFVMALLASCANSEKSSNQNSEEIVLEINYEKPQDSVVLKTDSRYKLYEQADTTLHLQTSTGIIKDSLNIPEGYYELSSKSNFDRIYLEKGSNIKMTVSDSITSFEGNAAEINDYIQKREKLNSETKKLSSLYHISKLDEKEFLKLNDSILSVFKDLANSEKLPEGFKENEINIAKVEKNFRLSAYPMARMRANRDFNTSEKYPEVFNDMNLNDKNLLDIDRFRVLFEMYANEKAKENNMETWEYVLSDNFPSESPEIKQEVFYTVGIFQLPQMKDPDEYYVQSQKILENEAKKKEITEKYLKAKNLAKGSEAPDFDLQTIAGDRVSLNDLKGNLVYLDIWTTSCAPCIKSMPDLRKLQEEYSNENIRFVSINVESNKERVLDILEKKNLGGIKTYDPAMDKKVMSNYAVNSFPRYVLIDEQGKIVDHMAPKPGEAELKKQLNNLLGS